MAFAPQTRTELRSSLKRKTANQLTNTTDQDIYINEAEQQALSDWVQFDKGLQQRTKQSASTDASGILLVGQGFSKLMRLQDANDVKYHYIDDPNEYPYRTGYHFLGYDASNKKRQLQILDQGSGKVSSTMEWWDVELAAMSTSTSTSSAIPAAYDELITYKGAEHWWEDQGPAFATHSARMAEKYEILLAKGRRQFGNPTQDPEFIESHNPDAGEYGHEHIVN